MFFINVSQQACKLTWIDILEDTLEDQKGWETSFKISRCFCCRDLAYSPTACFLWQCQQRAMRRTKYSCDIVKTSRKILLYVSNKYNFRSACMKQSQKPILDLHRHFGVFECSSKGCGGEDHYMRVSDDDFKSGREDKILALFLTHS